MKWSSTVARPFILCCSCPATVMSTSRTRSLLSSPQADIPAREGIKKAYALRSRDIFPEIAYATSSYIPAARISHLRSSRETGNQAFFWDYFILFHKGILSFPLVDYNNLAWANHMEEAKKVTWPWKDFFFSMSPQTRTQGSLFSRQGPLVEFFPKEAPTACLSVLTEWGSRAFHTALLLACKEKSRTAALNKDTHRNLHEIRTCQLCKIISPLSALASPNIQSVCFFQGLIHDLPWEFPLQWWIILALVIICIAMLLLQVWELCKIWVHLILRTRLMVADIVNEFSKPQIRTYCLTVKLNLEVHQNIIVKS